MGGSWVVNTAGLPDGYVPPSASMSPTVDADNRLDRAVDIAARHIIARSRVELRNSPFDERTLDALLTRIQELAPWPDQTQYEAAYDYLTSRADGKTS